MRPAARFSTTKFSLTLLSSLIFLPMAALVKRACPAAHCQWLLLLLLLASPMVIQNLTFPWTKLLAAFFVLLAWLQLVPGSAPLAGGRLVAAAMALAGGMLTHYSTGPWILALAAAWLTTQRHEFRRPEIRREALIATVVAALLLLTWVGWSVRHYGMAATFTQNSTVALGPALSPAARGMSAGGNLLATLSPVPLIGLEHPLLAQTSVWGRLRDGWFILYQQKLWWAFGSLGAVVLGWLAWRQSGGRARRFAGIAALVALVLGTAAHARLELLGVVHVVLQPLVLLGTAWIAARAEVLPRWLARLYAAGLLGDFIAGIALHFAVQGGWLDAGTGTSAAWTAFTAAAHANFQSKVNLGLVFADRGLAIPGLGLVLLVLAVACTAWNRCRPRGSEPA